MKMITREVKLLAKAGVSDNAPEKMYCNQRCPFLFKSEGQDEYWKGVYNVYTCLLYREGLETEERHYPICCKACQGDFENVAREE